MPESVAPDPLPGPVVEHLVEETKKMGLFLLGFELPTTAEVFGPASEFEIVSATRPAEHGSLDKQELDGWPFYLVVLRGQFVRRDWAPGAPPRAIATLIWSPTTETVPQGLSHDLPPAMSRLGAPHVISITGPPYPLRARDHTRRGLRPLRHDS